MEVMNNEGTTTSETTTETTQEMGASSAEQVSGAENTGTTNDVAPPSETGTDPQAVVAPPYVPTYKFKVKDKELEFDEFVRPSIKSKEHEQRLKEIYEQANGLPEVKQSRDEWKTKYSTVEGSINKLGQYVQKNDFNSFFTALNIPKEKIIEYAINELKFQELPPEQKATIEAQRQQQLALEQVQAQNQNYQTQMAEMVQRQTEFEMNQVFSRPDVALAVEKFDAYMGKPGTFKTEIIKRGQYYETVHGRSPSPMELVSEFLQFVGVNAPTQQGNLGASQQVMPGQAQQSKPTITSFASAGSKSPTKRVINSIDDIKKRREELADTTT